MIQTVLCDVHFFQMAYSVPKFAALFALICVYVSWDEVRADMLYPLEHYGAFLLLSALLGHHIMYVIETFQEKINHSVEFSYVGLLKVLWTFYVLNVLPENLAVTKFTLRVHLFCGVFALLFELLVTICTTRRRNSNDGVRF